MNIEIFPAEKSCEQACFACPMARKSGIVTATVINENVQTSFSIIEKLMKEKNVSYNLHTMALLDLFPTLHYPELIHMSRIETSPEVRMNSNAHHFSENVRELINGTGMNPKVIGFSVVPPFPVLNQSDYDVIKNLTNEIAGWYFKDKFKKIDVSIRSNLIPLDLFKKIEDQLLPADDQYLLKLARELGSAQCVSPRAFFDVLDEIPTYWNMYITRVGSNQVSLYNRVIAHVKSKNVYEMNIKQAFWLMPRSRGEVGFAFAPGGVILSHASFAINNPVMWMTHNDFRESLEQEIQRTGANFSFLRYAKNILFQNVVMQNYIVKRFHDLLPIKKEEFMKFFELNRSNFFRHKTPHRHKK